MNAYLDTFFNIVQEPDKRLHTENHMYDFVAKHLLDQNYQLKSVFGAGVNGIVFKLVNKTSRQVLALKVLEDIPKSVDVSLQVLFAKYDMAPKIHSTYKVKYKKRPLLFIMMDPITCSFRKSLRKGDKTVADHTSALECLLVKKMILGYIHGDMHTENIAVLEDGKTLGFIDFGFTIKKPIEYQILDAFPLIGDLANYKASDLRDGMIMFCLKFYKLFFNILLNTKNITSFIYNGKDVGGFMYKAGPIHLYSYLRDFPPQRGISVPKALGRVFPNYKVPRITK
jgi:hypothetical protein